MYTLVAWALSAGEACGSQGRFGAMHQELRRGTRCPLQARPDSSVTKQQRHERNKNGENDTRSLSLSVEVQVKVGLEWRMVLAVSGTPTVAYVIVALPFPIHSVALPLFSSFWFPLSIKFFIAHPCES